MLFTLNQIYGPDFSRKQRISKDVLVIHQQHDQEMGIEQRKARIKKARREIVQRIEKNRTMTEIINKARQNVANGNIIQVGV